VNTQSPKGGDKEEDDKMQNDIEQTLNYLHGAGGVFEVRAFIANRIHSGYFDDKAKASQEITRLTEKNDCKAVYVTLNPCDPALLARANNRMRLCGAKDATTSDKDITLLTNLLIDVDAVRPSGVSSSDDEHEAAIQFVRQIAEDLRKEGWSEPLLGDSGNGGHLIYPIDMENAADNVDLIKRFLQGLHGSYAGENGKILHDGVGLSIDQKVFNPARISKVYGTWARKGDNTPDRPHRLSKILSLPTERQPVKRELLEGIAIKVQPRQPSRSVINQSASNRRLNVEAYLQHYCVSVSKVKQHGDATLYVVEECGFDPSHRDGEAAIGQSADGKLFYQCFHDSCRDRTWKDVREAISQDDSLERFMVETCSPVDAFPKGQTAKKITERYMPRVFSAAELQQMEFKEPTFVIPGILPTGLSLLVGKPKIGKSYLLLNFALALSIGGRVIGQVDVEKIGVLYLSLEDRNQRLHARINELYPYDAWPKEFYMCTTWPRTSEGGLDQLRGWLSEHLEVKLVLIDTLAKIRGGQKRNASAYDEDYQEMGAIKDIADSMAVSILVCHHDRKMGAEDPLDAVSGTTGIAGSADTVLMLRREPRSGNATLYIRGRDIEEKELAFKRDPSGGWLLLGDAGEYSRSPEQLAVIELLRRSDGPMSPAEIAKELKKKPDAVQKLLGKLLGNPVIKNSFGKYTVPITYPYTTPFDQSVPIGLTTPSALIAPTTPTAPSSPNTPSTDGNSEQDGAGQLGDHSELDPYPAMVCKQVGALGALGVPVHKNLLEAEIETGVI
jgi:hypothetical protein